MESVTQRSRIQKFVLNDAGDPVPCEELHEWAAWLTANPGTSRRLAFDVAGHVSVSTIFRGFDHVVVRPMLWETIILGGPAHGETTRYATRDEALRGHEATVLRLGAQELDDMLRGRR